MSGCRARRRRRARRLARFAAAWSWSGTGPAADGRRAALPRGRRVRVDRARPAEQVDATGAAAGVELLAGGHRPEHLDGATLVVTSPGVPDRAPILRWAAERGLPVWSELELGARLCAVPYLAVTGTNGKTTTVELLAAMLPASGLKARACGNVGHPFSVAAREPWDVLAVEASSFQLYHVDRFHPRVSVLLNLAPDHLDWHGSIDAYAAAKARIFERQRRADMHVGNASDPAAAAVSSDARGATCGGSATGRRPGETGVEDGVRWSSADDEAERGRLPPAVAAPVMGAGRGRP